MVNENVLYAVWQLRQEAEISSGHTNCVIAAYVTTQARLVFYEHLEKLGKRMLYCDKDSCIFLCTGAPDEYVPKQGSLLGQMVD